NKSEYEKYSIEYDSKSSVNEILNEDKADFVEVFRSVVDTQNQLIYADNLLALRALLDEHEEKVTLVYIDPPFGTGFSFQSRSQKKAYDDNLVGAKFIEFLRKRIVLLHAILSSKGSIYVHLDENMVFPCKLILD